MSEEPGIVTVLIPLPIFYNPDRSGHRAPVEEQKFTKSAEEIAIGLQEGGVLHIFREGSPQGFWWDQGIVDRDVLAILEVDMRDTTENREWLKSYAREVLLGRFRQKAIYLKFVRPVERLLVTEEEARELVGTPCGVSAREGKEWRSDWAS